MARKHLSPAHRKAISDGLKAFHKKKGKRYSYKYIGTTYDGIKVIKPKTKSKRFSRRDANRAIGIAMGHYPKAAKRKSRKSIHPSVMIVR